MASNSVGLDVATESVVGPRPSFRSQFIQSDTFQFSYGLWIMDYGKGTCSRKGSLPKQHRIRDMPSLCEMYTR